MCFTLVNHYCYIRAICNTEEEKEEEGGGEEGGGGGGRKRTQALMLFGDQHVYSNLSLSLDFYSTDDKHAHVYMHVVT